MAILGAFEFQVLAVLAAYPGDDYGVKVREHIMRAVGREISVGALYTTLQRLELKGFVSSRWGESTEVRGGRRKRHYRIEASGRRALREAQSLQASFIRMRPAGT
jgi:DNA-binding PadR family transcriptional regulator